MRHCKGLGATALAFLAVLVLASLALYQADQARQQRDEARAVAGMLRSLMQLVNPDIGMGHQLDAHTILRTTLDRIIGDSSSSDQTRIELLQTLAAALVAFDLTDGALRARREIHHIQAERNGAQHPTTLGALREYAVVLSKQRSDFRECERLFTQLLKTRRSLLGENHLETAQSYRDLGFLYLRYSDQAHPGRQRSLELIDRAYQIYAQQLGQEHVLVGETLFDLGLATANPTLRIERMRRGIEIRQLHVHAEDLVLLKHQGDLAMVLSEAGLVEEGLELGRLALERFQAVRGELHPTALTLQNNLAGMYRDHGRYEQALGLYRRVDELIRATVPQNHLKRAFPQYGIGRSLNALGRPAEAQPWLRGALEILEYNQSYNLIGITRIELGDCLRAQGQTAEAARQYQAALDIYQQHLARGKQNPQVLEIQQRLASVL